jgi:hypothetical protein
MIHEVADLGVVSDVGSIVEGMMKKPPLLASTGIRAMAVVALLANAEILAAEPPVGPPFRVNTYTTGAQRAPSVALLVGLTSFVTWQSGGQDGSGYGIFGQRLGTFATPLGGEFRVNSYTSLDQSSPRVASDFGGIFVVVWQSDGQDGDRGGIFGQRYANAGNPLGAEFRVNTYTSSGQALPAVGVRYAAGNSDFVVVWTSAGQDGSGEGIFGQRYAGASGAPLGPEFQVNTYTTGPQRSASVVVDPNGGFLVVWEGLASAEDGFGIFGQRYASTGAPLGGEFRVNSYTTGHQRYPSVGGINNGDFFVAWQSDGQDGSGLGVYAQRYSNAGAPLAGEFRVSAYTTSDQSSPEVWAGGSFVFVVTWQSDHEGPGADVFFEHFLGGTPINGERRANTYTTGSQTEPSVAYQFGNGGIVAWTSNEDPDGSPGVYAQVYFDFPVELRDFVVE